jgi:hypothetical protein
MSAVFILPLVEEAAVNFLAAQTFAQADEDGIKLDSARILKGFQHTATVAEEPRILLPSIVCSCVTANDEEDFASGNWIADLVVEFRSKSFDGSDSSNKAMAEEAFTFFFSTTIAADLSGALAGFTAFLVVPQQQTRAIENNVWISRAAFAVHCCGSDIS